MKFLFPKKLLKLILQGKLLEVYSIVISVLRIPDLRSSRQKWQYGISSEIFFWKNVVSSNGRYHNSQKEYLKRLDNNLPLQERPSKLLPDKYELNILDVGSGPLTYLGKTLQNHVINIVATDPLADDYNKILKENNIMIPVKLVNVAAEALSLVFDENSFDLVFARNSIDHSFNPEMAIDQMIRVTAKGSYLLLEHKQNEGKTQNYDGLHQWNFDVNPEGDFVISSKYKNINITKKYLGKCKIRTETVFDDDAQNDLLIVRILKL